MDKETYTVTQFCNFVKNVLPNKKFSVIGEINQLKNSHGHLFFTFKDNENCLSATIWKSRAEQIKANLKEGDKVTVEGRLDFYSATGKLNFIVDKIRHSCYIIIIIIY
jgi:exodeoxyribonuclease VII large subunit